MDHMIELPLLQVRGVGKVYSRRVAQTRKRLGKAAKEVFFNSAAPAKETAEHGFWALKDVNFELYRGSAVGIIGLNGSGKTTLLRMLAGQILPDAGDIIINGTSAAMIDLTAGFRQSAPGRENIYLRAAALGFSRKQTEKYYDEIVAFSELGDTIHAPLSTYSAGMKMRLAFSVMSIVAPDLLLIDEVLAVGDFQFKQKCKAKIREMRERSAFVFVSHSMGSIMDFCDHVLVLNKGRVLFEGPPEEAIAVYEALEVGGGEVTEESLMESRMGPSFENADVLRGVEHFWCDADGNPINETEFERAFQLKVKFTSSIDVRKLRVGVPVWSINRHYTTGLSTQISSDDIDIRKGVPVELVLDVEPGYINPGAIKSMLAIMDGVEFLYRKANPDLTILPGKHPTWGAVTVPHKWRQTQGGVTNKVTSFKPRLIRKG